MDLFQLLTTIILAALKASTIDTAKRSYAMNLLTKSYGIVYSPSYTVHYAAMFRNM